MKTVDIGNLCVVPKGSPNPYRSGVNLMGRERSQALGQFLRTGVCGAYDFWLCHPSGGAIRLTQPPAVDPEVMDFYWDEYGMPKRA